MLINNNVINLKNINVRINKRNVFINNCKIIILIEIKNFDISIFKFIYLRKIIIISFRLKILMKIYYFLILKRDYIFNKNLFYFII